MASGSSATGADPELSSFPASLSQHLTKLTLTLTPKIVTQNPQAGKVHHLHALGMLTALQELELGCVVRPDWDRIYCDLAGEKLIWKLPHLISLRMQLFNQGGVVLSCPKLAKAKFTETISLHVEVEHAALESLTLFECYKFRHTLRSPRDQLQGLRSLDVLLCNEIGRQLIEDVPCMRQLQKLKYGAPFGFPAACMPACFPHSLQKLELVPQSWACDLPGGLKELHELTCLRFQVAPQCTSWVIVQPLHELLPFDCLEILELGSRFYSRREDLEALRLRSRSASHCT